MAKNSQGLIAQFDGNDLGEVVSISVDGVNADMIEVTPRSHAGRDKVYRSADGDLGTVTITARAPSFVIADVGGPYREDGSPYSAVLVIDSVNDGNLFNFNALIQSLAWRASVGELQEYTVVFKVGTA